MDIKQAINEEIRRLARKEIKAALTPLTEKLSEMRKLIIAQRRQIAELSKIPRVVKTTAENPPEAVIAPKLRLNAYGIVKIRHKLGMTQTEFARVLGVCMNTVSFWETARYSPCMAHKLRICELRKLGKRGIKKLKEDHAAA